jgi:hypothetical protein
MADLLGRLGYGSRRSRKLEHSVALAGLGSSWLLLLLVDPTLEWGRVSETPEKQRRGAKSLDISGDHIPVTA